MGAAYENGILIPSTADPSGTQVVTNTGQNLQIAASVVPMGTLSSSGQACNILGGYTWNPATAQCEQQGQASPQASSATPPGFTTQIDPATGATVLVANSTMSGSPQQCTTPACLADMAAANAGGGSAAGTSTGSGLFGLSTTDLLIAAAVIAALFLVSK
jgi:hypothetical protein